MRILVIGSGGREHALVWKLAQSPRASQIFCAPGNPGIAAEKTRSGNPVECVPLGAEEIPALLEFARQRSVDLTVVGPDNPLALGIVDRFEAAGLRIWGPRREAARLESSKVFAQGFMERNGIPCARSGCFDNPAEARRFAASLEGRCAVKADGLALGKGVILCQNQGEAETAIANLMEERAFGEAGERVVIQEFLHGREFSAHALCDGKTALLFPPSQDHKRALENDQGLNTGGMGTCCPVPFVTSAVMEEIQRVVLDRFLEGCAREGLVFRGLLYPGIMLTAEGPKVIEFNARFGDPETQVYLTRLENDLLDLLEASVEGFLSGIRLQWTEGASVCVVMASGGYPGACAKGKVIHGLEVASRLPRTKVFQAGTRREGENIVTNGGRVLGVTAWGADVRAAREAALEAVAKIGFDGAQFRRDIGLKSLE
jgi:phosphoribosylamine--glycine ligase